jgi:hypothetical protein
VFPNCTAKAKGERQVFVGQQLLEARELGGMVVRRPIDRVRDAARRVWCALSQDHQQVQCASPQLPPSNSAVVHLAAHFAPPRVSCRAFW